MKPFSSLFRLSLVLLFLAAQYSSHAQAVTTFAGSGAASFMDATGVAAQFNQPSGIARDGSGNFYVADRQNNRIRRISALGVVTTFAGSGTAGSLDGTGAGAQFSGPTGVAVDGTGNVYVADFGSHRIRKITPGGVVTTLAGSMGGFADGTGAAAQFQFPAAVAVDGAGNVFVADYLNHRIRRVTPVGVVTTLAGSTGGFADGTGAGAQFNLPAGVAVNGAGTIVYVADQNNHRIRAVTTAGGVVTTIAGAAAAFADGTGAVARFNTPVGVAINGAGNIVVADQGNNRIRVVTPGGITNTIAGSGAAGFMDATGLTAQFNAPSGVVVDGAGNIFVADQTNHRIRSIAPVPPPTITSILPTSGGAATVVTITGTNFTGASAVSFGGVAATSFMVVNATTITATVAAGGATGNVDVTTAGGTASFSMFTFIPAPTIGSFLPTSAGGGTTITITGTNFTGATAVSFGGTAAASFMVVSATQIDAVVGAGGATGNVVVTTPGGTATLGTFTFILAPVITSFAPLSAAGGATITINGMNFTGVSAVSFGGTAAASFNFVSATQVTAVVAAGGSTGPVSLTTPGGTVNFGTFTFLSPPTITGFSPTTAGPGATITIMGTNLTGPTAASFGGTAAMSFLGGTPTSMTAVVGAGATGNISITTPSGTAISPGTFTFVPTPTITSITPTSGLVGDLITITGTNFVAPAIVTVGTVTATGVMVMSPTTITANVGGVGSAGNIRVATPGGTSTPFASFTFLAPTITSFLPTSAAATAMVTITGTNFTGATAVSFGGVAATSFLVVNNTTITAIVAAGSLSGNVQVTTPGGSPTLGGFVFLAPPPTITSFSPMSAGPGMTVTINGTNFVGMANVTGVSFGATAAASYTVVSPTQINAVVAAGGSTGVINVTTLSGNVNSAATFTFVPAPTITSFTPMNGVMGASIVITGTDFTGATQVRFGGTPTWYNAASYVINSPTQITAVLGVGGSGNVQVTTPGGTATTAGGFTFNAPMPTITNFTPVNGGNGTAVVITGTGFTGVSQVQFGGVNAASFVEISPTQINATVAAGGATGNVSVTTPGGTATRSGFTFFLPPTLALPPAFTPTSAGATTVITISGTNFTGATQVRFGLTPATTYTVVSSTVITAVVPLLPVGNYSVSVTTPGGTATTPGTPFTFVPAPTISGFTPLTGGAGTPITINGAFTGTVTGVTIGGVPATITSFTSTQVFATVGPGATGPVAVTTIGGTASFGTFTFVPAPTITSFTPTAGITGTLITINGMNFTGATQVRFGMVAATSFTVISSTQITAMVGAGANGSVAVTTPGGTATLGGFIHSFFAPTITGFAPTNAGLGTTVTITGTNFTSATQVQFGGVNAASYTVVSATQINAVVGAGASGNVTVTTPGGTSNQAGFVFVPAPTVTSFTPTSEGLNNVVTIMGTNFTGATAVTFGGTPALSYTVISPTQINATVGIGASGNVAVTTIGGTGTMPGFTYLYFPPTITSFTPTSQGGGNLVTINGTNFVGVSAVSFGGVPATGITIISPTQITVNVGASGASGIVSVTTPGGTATMGGFTYIPAPVITSFTPMSRGAGGTVTIVGNNFTGSTAVSFGGVPAMSFMVGSSTLITAVVGAGASGMVSVTSPNGTGTMAGFTFISAPNVTSVAPASAAAGATVTITGTNFTGATQVQFGGVNATSFMVVSATQITAVVAAGSGNGISVTGPGGTGAFAGFTFITAPTISSFTPTSAAGGATVLINGANFTGATAVSFGGVPAASFNVITSSLMTATVAAGASGTLAVTTPGGTGTLAGFTFLPGPTISSFLPATAGPGMTVTVTGAGFTGATVVQFGGMPAASFVVVNATTITAIVGAGGATGSVSVTTPGGTFALPGFTFVPAPTITSFMPTNAAPGATVTINGTNFTGATQVRFGGTLAGTFNVITPTQVTAVVPAGATTGSVSVTTAGGIANFAGFVYLAPPPTITTFAPTTAGMGLTVVINGTFLSAASAVSFGGTPASSFTVMSDNMIHAVVAAGSSGMVSVTTPGGTITSAGFIYSAAPTLTGFVPLAASSGATVLLTGTNFGTATNVSFGGVPAASFMSISGTQISAVVPPMASNGAVSVTTPGGTASLMGFSFIPPPTLSNFTPLNSGPGLPVVLTGTGFTGATAVSFGGVPAMSFVIDSPTQITANVGAAGATGVVSVTSTGGTVSRAGFTFFPTPTVTALSPATTGTGSVVIITGTGFTGAGAVRFGGLAATSFTVNSPTQISAVVASGSTGTVSVTTPGGTGALTGFTFVNVPTITSFTPVGSEPGGVVTINGTNFTGASAVSFGGRPATSFTVVSATQITAVVPANAGDPITVTTVGGTAMLGGFMYLPSPRITSISPMNAGVGQTVTIIGTNFTGTTDVSFGGVPATNFMVVSPTVITATVSSEGASGTVSVTSPEGTGTFAGFTFIPPVPTITSISPTTAGPGIAVTITGTGFLGTTIATFGGFRAQRITVVSSREITAIVGTGATGSVVVNAAGGTASIGGFTFVPAPTITSISPPSAAQGTTVTITGTNLTGVLSVTFGGIPATSFRLISPTQIEAVVSAGGNVAVTTPGGTVVSSGFTTIPPPVILSFTPTTSGSGATITILGFNFTAASAVRFGGVTAASYTVVSPTQILAIVSTGANAGSTGSVAVTTTAGTATLSGYTFVPAPRITSFSPQKVGTRQLITITGTNLATVREVRFGGATAASFSVVSPTEIRAIVGTGATGSVSIATIGGTASLAGFTFVPAPIITSFSPTIARTGTVATIIGANFTEVVSVRFGGLPAASFRILSDSLISAVVALNSSSGSVTVISTGGTGSLAGFRYIAPEPTITDFTPSTAGRGTTVIVNGTNFVGVTGVSFGNTPAASFTIFSPTQLSAVVGEGASGAIAVTTLTGMAELGGFSFSPQPVITAFSPASAGAGSTVTIDGLHFTAVREVRFGNVPASSIAQISPTRITAIVATGATGEVSVTALGGTGSRPGFTFVPAPTLTSFSPNPAGRQTTITITGTNLANTVSVRIGGFPAITFANISATRITAMVADAARSSLISVTTIGGTAEIDGLVFLEAPTIAGFSPTSAGPGSTITITGTNFTSTATVSFGGVNATNVVFVSPTLLRAIVPSSTTGGTITVRTEGGTGTSTGALQLLSPPRITSFSPVRARSGATITITGVNLAGVTAVSFGGVAATEIRQISDTQITAVVTTGATGNVSVTAQGGANTLGGFTFIAPPVITGFSPRGAGEGLAVTIIGTNFNDVSMVSFGGMRAARLTFVSPTQITAIVGTGATGNISVSAEGGTGELAGFRFIPKPVVTSLTPSVGAVGTPLVITGENFTGASSVVVGNVSLPFTVNNDKQITVIIPVSGATTGTVTVTSQGGVGISTQSFRFVPPPSIDASAFVQSRQGVILRITGANFLETQRVNIGQANVQFTVVNPTQVTASIPPGVSQSDVVMLVTPGGVARTAGMPPLPSITSVTPSRGRPGTRITITGQNLGGTTQASIGGVNIVPQVLSSTQVTLTIPPEGVSGAIGLTTPLGVVTTTTNFILVTNAPLILSFSPTRGDGGTVIQVFGENFASVSQVFIGGVSIPFRLISTSEMVLTIPRTGATSGNIVLSSPLGVASSAGRFIFTPGGVAPPTPTTPQGVVRCYPNPSSENVTFAYNLASPQVVTIRVLDIRGSLLRIINAGAKDTGEHTESFSLEGIAPGTYIVSVETPKQRIVGVFTVVR